MKNQVLSKILARNLCVVIQEQREPGIDSVFWKDAKETGRDVLPMTHA